MFSYSAMKGNLVDLHVVGRCGALDTVRDRFSASMCFFDFDERVANEHTHSILIGIIVVISGR